MKGHYILFIFALLSICIGFLGIVPPAVEGLSKALGSVLMVAFFITLFMRNRRPA
jgi:hypothetical protein